MFVLLSVLQHSTFQLYFSRKLYINPCIDPSYGKVLRGKGGTLVILWKSNNWKENKNDIKLIFEVCYVGGALYLSLTLFLTSPSLSLSKHIKMKAIPYTSLCGETWKCFKIKICVSYIVEATLQFKISVLNDELTLDHLIPWDLNIHLC